MSTLTITPPSPAMIKARAFVQGLKFDTLSKAGWADSEDDIVKGAEFDLPYNQPEEKAFADAVYEIMLSGTTKKPFMGPSLTRTQSDEFCTGVGGSLKKGSGKEFDYSASFSFTKDLFNNIQTQLSQGLNK